jgi:branched-chain amino acid transport system substrate-binding protein
MNRILGIVYAIAALWAAGCADVSAQQSPAPVRIGVLTDIAGPFADISGPGAVMAVRMAVEDFGGRVLGRPIEVLTADHQNKPDVGASTARRWFDQEGVAAVQDLVNSAVALAVMDLAASNNRIALVNGASTSAITNEKCMRNTVHYTWDTYALAKSTATAVVKSGGKSWYFLTVDFAYGQALERDAVKFVEAAGGTVAGRARHPLNNPDFSSFMIQAQSSGAKIVGLANAGADTINSIKTANEFGIMRAGQRLAALGFNLNDTAALGLAAARGILFTEAFYWDMNDETRAWSKRFFERFGKMPTSTQAGNYSSTMHYLKAVQAAGSTDGDKVMSKMREFPINDFFAKNGRIREDGRMVHDMYLMEVKDPSESKGPWDFYKLISTIPGDQAFRSLSESACPLVKH